MENSGYVIKVERALSIVSVQFWSTFPQKVNSFDVDVNWFYDNFSITNDIRCKMSLRNQHEARAPAGPHISRHFSVSAVLNVFSDTLPGSKTMSGEWRMKFHKWTGVLLLLLLLLCLLCLSCCALQPSCARE